MKAQGTIRRKGQSTRSGVRRRKSGVGSQKTEVRRQKSGDRRRKTAVFAAVFCLCAEHVRQLGGESPLHSLMEAK